MLKNFLKRLRGFIFPYYILLDKWMKINRDKSLRLNYNLNRTSIVFDLGGYKGEWTENIFSKYHCKVYIFEPVKKFSENIRKKFKKNKKIFVYNFGLSEESKYIKISLDGEGSSIFKKYNNDKSERIYLMCAKDFIIKNNINKIDLMKINIEGAEYDLINYFIDSGMINKIDNLQVQFHKMFKGYLYWSPFYTTPNIKRRRIDIQKKLEKTHFLTYNYPFIWENWEKKKIGVNYGNKK